MSLPLPRILLPAGMQSVADPGSEEALWLDLRPRWPLTSFLHPRAAEPEATQAVNKIVSPKTPPGTASRYGVLSARKSRQHLSLTDITLAAGGGLQESL